ncbi:MgtC/SapB family protein [Xanthobacteraceae bacterium A53D]
MPLHAEWGELALRIICAFAASFLIGLDRELHERSAGMRTTILVCLAACFAMICANLLLPEVGKEATSFVQIDVMRLPLGILTGMGFIGAGAIMRRDDGLVLGVTTAATLWFVTVMGLAFGAGLYILGGAACLCGVITLWLLKYLEGHLHKDREAHLRLVLGTDGPSEADLRALLKAPPFRIRRTWLRIDPATGQRELRYELRIAALAGEAPPELVATLAARPGVERVEWDS